MIVQFDLNLGYKRKAESLETDLCLLVHSFFLSRNLINLVHHDMLINRP